MEFLVTSLVVVLMPGTGVIYTVSTGLFKGWQASIAAASGCTLGILPLFVSSETTSPLLQMFLLSAVFMGMTLVIFILYGISANSVRGYVAKSPKWIVRLQRSFAMVFAVLSVKLAMTER